MKTTSMVVLGIASLAGMNMAYAGGGPLGIDHRLNYDNQGIWKRSNQIALEGILVGGEIAGSLWEGSDSRLGRTFWQAMDASVIADSSALAMKYAFGRARPSQTDNPNKWHQGSQYQSFPSGEVTATTAIVTPFVLEYGHDYPAVYALELLPLYDAEARMKVWGHWQTDVLAGYAIGTLAGYYAHSRKMPFTVSVLPCGLTVGWKHKF